MEGLVPRFELDTPRVNSEAPIGLIKKTSTIIIEISEIMKVMLEEQSIKKTVFCHGELGSFRREMPTMGYLRSPCLVSRDASESSAKGSRRP